MFIKSMNLFTFFLHACAEAFLESTGRAATPVVPIHKANVVSSACVRSTVSYGALEETLASFASADTIVLAGGFIAANSTLLLAVGFDLR